MICVTLGVQRGIKLEATFWYFVVWFKRLYNVWLNMNLYLHLWRTSQTELHLGWLPAVLLYGRSSSSTVLSRVRGCTCRVDEPVAVVQCSCGAVCVGRSIPGDFSHDARAVQTRMKLHAYGLYALTECLSPAMAVMETVALPWKDSFFTDFCLLHIQSKLPTSHVFFQHSYRCTHSCLN